MSAFIGPAVAEDELGVWQPASPIASDGVILESTGVDPAVANSPDNVSVWLVALPNDRSAAARALDLAEARLAVAESALPQAVSRLKTFAAAGGPSPAIAPELEAPELELASWSAISQSAGGFGSQESAGQSVEGLVAAPAFQQAVDRTRAFFDKVRETLAEFTVVETDLGGVRAALTRVSWTGDMRTAWAYGLSADDARQHLRAVSLALRTRDAWLRLALTVVRGALQLVPLFAVTPLLALPAAYRFIRQIIDQVQALRALPGLA